MEGLPMIIALLILGGFAFIGWLLWQWGRSKP